MSTVAKPIVTDLVTSWTPAVLNSGLERAVRRRGSKDTSSQHCSFPKSSHKPHRICGVCGDRARSLHFGGLSCDSCKAFFRRAVQSGTYKNFQCPQQPSGWDKFCVITVASRKSCQKCRFEACVQIGMEISWVMSEAERQRLLVTRMAKKRKIDCDPTDAECSMPCSSTSEPGSPVLLHKSRPLQDYLWPLYPDNVCIESFMCPSEVAIVEKVKAAWSHAMLTTPPTRLEGRDLNNMEIDHSELVRAINGSIKRFQAFGAPLFVESDVIEKDKTTILRSSMLDLCILRTALNHFRGAMLFERYFPSVLHEVHCRFVKGLQELSLDQTTMLLFLAVILLSPDRPHLEQPQKVEKLQEFYLMLLYKYMVGRYGMPKASALYPKLLSKMADIQELSDCHQEQYLLFAHHEVQSVKKELNRFQNINMSPPSYDSCQFTEQQPLTSFHQTFASPVAPAPNQDFIPTTLPSSGNQYLPQATPMTSDPNVDGGYVSFEDKQDYFFEGMNQCQSNAFNQGASMQSPIHQQACFTPCSPDVPRQMPFQFQSSEFCYSERVAAYPNSCQEASLKDFKSEQDLSTCFESSLGSSLSSNFGSSPRTLNGEDYFNEFSSPVFSIDDATESPSSFFGAFNR